MGLIDWRKVYEWAGKKLDRGAEYLGFDPMMQIDNMADLPDGTVVVDAYAVIKVLDPDGGVGFHTRQTSDLSDWEALGMLIAATDKLRKQLQENWEPDDGLP